MEKNKEPIKVVIDGNEYNFENYSFNWEGKPYIKKPNKCEITENLVALLSLASI